jgi:hypothetical protein
MRGDAADGLDKAARVAPNILEVEEGGSPVLDSGSEFKKKKKAKVGGEEEEGDGESDQCPTPSL